MEWTKKNLLLLALLTLVSCEASNEKTSDQPATSAKATVGQAEQVAADEQTPASAEEEKIFAKIKAKVKRDYPEDYSIQLVLYNQEIADYHYMKTVTDLAIKKKVAREYPFDFSIQKALYNQEIDAKEQMQ